MTHPFAVSGKIMLSGDELTSREDKAFHSNPKPADLLSVPIRIWVFNRFLQ